MTSFDLRDNVDVQNMVQDLFLLLDYHLKAEEMAY